MNAWIVTALMTAAAAGAGCVSAPQGGAQPGQPWYQSMVAPMHKDADRALRYYERVNRLKAADLVRELESARQAFDEDKSDLNRLQLALLLSLPHSGIRDDGAALVLLQPVAKGKEGEELPLRPLALLLHNELVERRRADEALQQQTLRTREEQRRADGLQQKLEAIMEMEMKMIEREQAAPPKSR